MVSVHAIKRYFLLIILFSCFSYGMDGSVCLHDDSKAASSSSLATRDDDGYWSDSEDEEGYSYKGLSSPKIPAKIGRRCLLLERGIHFSPSLFTKERMSRMKRHDDAGKDHYSAAAFDLTNDVPLGEPGDNVMVLMKAKSCKKFISSLPQSERNTFQQTYSNSDDTFHKKLADPKSEPPFNRFISKRNPQVSTSEVFRHAIKYALGLKYLGQGREPLDPAYDAQGKPRHPYLGKLFVFLVDERKVKELDPYFVVQAHANYEITINDYFRKDVLSEREVSIPGFIPGECVVFSIPVRVPSFKGEYKSWYHEKYGISNRIFNARRDILLTGKSANSNKSSEELRKHTVQSLLEKVILPHLALRLETHVKQACVQRGIDVVYKTLNGEFGPHLPDFWNVSQRRNDLARIALAGDRR